MPVGSFSTKRRLLHGWKGILSEGRYLEKEERALPPTRRSKPINVAPVDQQAEFAKAEAASVAVQQCQVSKRNFAYQPGPPMKYCEID